MSYADDWADDFPETLREDEILMDFIDQLFDENLRGDDWHAIRDGIADYMWDEYLDVLDDYFDWEDYGEWYDSTH